MKNLLSLVLLFSSITLFSQSKHIVVFASEDVCYLDVEKPCKRGTESETLFFNKYKGAMVKGLPQK